jgi:hypothetical protein
MKSDEAFPFLKVLNIMVMAVSKIMFFFLSVHLCYHMRSLTAKYIFQFEDPPQDLFYIFMSTFLHSFLIFRSHALQ